MIFIDSTALVGLLLKNDQWHNDAENIQIPYEKLVINNLVLTETLNIISKRSLLNVETIYKKIKKGAEIICLTDDDYLNAMQKCVYYNNSINYSDCLILTTMEKVGVNKIVSFDSGFDKVNGINRIYV